MNCHQERYTSSRIMVVDDELTNLKLVHKILTNYGYSNIELISDPREVIPRYRQSPPCLILLDLNMPFMDGYAVLNELKRLEDPLSPPVLILTAQIGQEYLLKAFDNGVRDYITKPFDMFELAARVRNLLEVHAAHLLIHDEKKVLDNLVRERTMELMQTRLQIVRKLGRAAEYRDNETGRHILRVSHTTVLLARELGWSETEQETLLHATPMHDIGKIGIPDSILLKPGKLNVREWEQMKTHTLIGGRILEGDDSELLDRAREIALSHHEWWDGSGYPQGLAGESIPLSGRIVSVADVFDALTSERVYKKAWGIDEAMDYIRSNRGRQFDPKLVELFLRNFDEIMSIAGRFKDP